MKCVHTNDCVFSTPEFYNANPRINLSADVPCREFSSDGEVLLDDYYGNFIKKDDYVNRFVYTNFCKSQIFLPPTKDYFFVPNKKIPIYECDSIEQINKLLPLLRCGKNEVILFRGQTKTYPIMRDDVERFSLYGVLDCVEPSFLTSGCRKNIADVDLRSMWNFVGSIVANDLAWASRCDTLQLDQFLSDPRFDLFAYGIAQHYGLPSVGLDLTDSLENALWFASNNYTISNGVAEIRGLESDDEPIIYIFRFPNRAVAEYSKTKPSFFKDCSTRPDRQKAWFAHVGWGAAKNQAALFLEAAIKVPPLYVTNEEKTRYLFPSRKEDLMLDFILKIKKRFTPKDMCYRMLDGIYDFVL